MVLENLSQQIAEMNPMLAPLIQQYPWMLPLIFLQIVMKFAFYPVALYLAGKRQQKAWFTVLVICFLVLNDFGLLAALYLIFNRDKKHSEIHLKKK